MIDPQVSSRPNSEMRLIRYADPSGTPFYAAWGEDGKYYKAVYSESGALEVTNEVADSGHLLPPVAPVTIFAVGINYPLHGKETGSKMGQYPIIFMKSPSTVAAPGQDIVLPRHLRSDKVDYEGELAVVIGKTCKNVAPENALDYVLGYTIANDVSARDWQKEWGGGQFCRGKTFDTFCPLGPQLVTPDEIPDPNNLTLQTRLNGELVQDGHTRDMAFKVPEIIAFLSGGNTLLPGTLILTGTPDGVGAARTPPRFLQVGDTVEITIEGIGTLSNSVVEEEL
jgi:2-keto-4-pentenoate hydratase/2-oxohepta-3-ene-1,7-dioic acid hydratase in catechol pathway